MSLLVWIILGLVSGFIASMMINRRGEGFLLNTVLGLVGAVLGGWFFSIVGMADVSGLNLYSVFVAIVGAMAVLLTYRFLVPRARY